MDIDKILKLQEEVAANETDIAYAYVDALKDAIGDLYSISQIPLPMPLLLLLKTVRMRLNHLRRR